MTLPAGSRVLAGLLWATATLAAAGETPAVVYEDGLLAIRCADAPLGHLLDQVKAVTGMDLIFEGAAPTARLTAHLEAQPMSLALPRLLEGTGVDYLLVADGADPRRVATLYVGGVKAGVPAAATPASAASRRAARPRGAPPMAEPEALPIPEAPPEPEPSSDDDEVDTTAEVEPPPGAGAIPGLAPGAAGGQPMLDPFGRAIPMRGAADRPGRAVRRGRGNAADEQ
jgi:hypothetical protein